MSRTQLAIRKNQDKGPDKKLRRIRNFARKLAERFPFTKARQRRLARNRLIAKMEAQTIFIAREGKRFALTDAELELRELAPGWKVVFLGSQGAGIKRYYMIGPDYTSQFEVNPGEKHSVDIQTDQGPKRVIVKNLRKSGSEVNVESLKATEIQEKRRLQLTDAQFSLQKLAPGWQVVFVGGSGGGVKVYNIIGPSHTLDLEVKPGEPHSIDIQTDQGPMRVTVKNILSEGSEVCVESLKKSKALVQ
jgi:hypothetical protein